MNKLLTFLGFGDKSAEHKREQAQIKKVEESQYALLTAATSTADAAHVVTSILRDRLDDSLRQLEVTSKLLSDSLILCSHDGTIESANPITEHMFGWAHDAIIGQNIHTLFRGSDGALMSLDEIIEAFTANTNNPNPLLEVPMEYMRGKKNNGRLFWVDGDVTIIDRLDGTQKIMFLSRDVTTRVETLRELEQNELRYRSIFEQSFDAILVVRNHFVVAANPALERILGFTPDEMIAQPMSTVVHPDYHRIVFNDHDARMNGEMGFIAETMTGMHKNGSSVELLWTSSALYWEGKPGSLITIRDVSEFKALGGNVDALLQHRRAAE
jgi:PAS domain S-box-containing protein